MVHEFVHEPQYCFEVWRSTAPVQAPQALFTQLCVPVLQLPQLRVVPFWHATHMPLLARHSGVAPEQAVWFVHAPEVEQRRGVRPTQSRAPGWQIAHFLLTQMAVLQSELWVQASPTSQLPQFTPGPVQELKLCHVP